MLPPRRHRLVALIAGCLVVTFAVWLGWALTRNQGWHVLVATLATLAAAGMGWFRRTLIPLFVAAVVRKGFPMNLPGIFSGADLNNAEAAIDAILEKLVAGAFPAVAGKPVLQAKINAAIVADVAVVKELLIDTALGALLANAPQHTEAYFDALGKKFPALIPDIGALEAKIAAAMLPPK